MTKIIVLVVVITLGIMLLHKKEHEVDKVEQIDLIGHKFKNEGGGSDGL